jgi:GNAT superfamily N-acetyltransferase
VSTLESALFSERLLGHAPVIAGESEARRVLLVKDLSPEVSLSSSGGALRRIESERDWQVYVEERSKVERAYGLDERAVRGVVGAMRRTSEELRPAAELEWYFFSVEAEVVGAVGLLVYVFEDRCCARLQDVDVFPEWRRRGHGNAMLAAAEREASARAGLVSVAADRGDWPRGWYRRRGYREVALLGPARASAAER